MKHVVIHTDGACLGNPGPGGIGVVLAYGKHRRTLSESHPHTTNNRMELLAAIRGLELLKEPCSVELVTDSRYLANAINKGWLESWKRRNWKRPSSKGGIIKNQDLWKRLDALLRIHKVSFRWVEGHSGHRWNEECDRLATTAAEAAKNGAALDTL
ncbi:MAG: ribonuclease HI [Candidatus Hydrogenedentota bacterium]|nr:MAG: ribonuclease HI [Candidatus Hydrogenedentota bacterium]